MQHSFSISTVSILLSHLSTATRPAILHVVKINVKKFNFAEKYLSNTILQAKAKNFPSKNIPLYGI